MSQIPCAKCICWLKKSVQWMQTLTKGGHVCKSTLINSVIGWDVYCFVHLTTCIWYWMLHIFIHTRKNWYGHTGLTPFTHTWLFGDTWNTSRVSPNYNICIFLDLLQIPSLRPWPFYVWVITCFRWILQFFFASTQILNLIPGRKVSNQTGLGDFHFDFMTRKRFPPYRPLVTCGFPS